MPGPDTHYGGIKPYALACGSTVVLSAAPAVESCLCTDRQHNGLLNLAQVVGAPRRASENIAP